MDKAPIEPCKAKTSCHTCMYAKRFNQIVAFNSIVPSAIKERMNKRNESNKYCTAIYYLNGGYVKDDDLLTNVMRPHHEIKCPDWNRRPS